METTQPTTAKLSVVLPKVSETSVPSSPSKETLSQASMASGTPTSVLEPPLLVVSLAQPRMTSPELQAKPMPAQVRTRPTRHLLSEMLQNFCLVPEARMDSLVSPAQWDELLPLEKTNWSRSKMLDLCTIDALNYFCEKQRVRQHSLLQEAEHTPVALCLPEPNTVVSQPRDQDHGYHSILRLQEKAAQSSGMRLRGRMLYRHSARTLDGAIHTLKLPLPRVEPQPFPPGWPKTARLRPPQLLQPALQRYFLPEDTDPTTYS